MNFNCSCLCPICPQLLRRLGQTLSLGFDLLQNNDRQASELRRCLDRQITQNQKGQLEWLREKVPPKLQTPGLQTDCGRKFLSSVQVQTQTNQPEEVLSEVRTVQPSQNRSKMILLRLTEIFGLSDVQRLIAGLQKFALSFVKACAKCQSRQEHTLYLRLKGSWNWFKRCMNRHSKPN